MLDSPSPTHSHDPHDPHELHEPPYIHTLYYTPPYAGTIIITIITIITFRSLFCFVFPTRSISEEFPADKHLPSSASPLFIPPPPPYQLHTHHRRHFRHNHSVFIGVRTCISYPFQNSTLEKRVFGIYFYRFGKRLAYGFV